MHIRINATSFTVLRTFENLACMYDIYVCEYICMRVRTYVCVYVLNYVCLNICISECILVYMFASTSHVHVRVYVCMY